MPAAPQASPMTPKSTNGATWSRTSSKKSKSSVVSPPDTTKPTPASEPLSISSQPSWPSSECRQTLEGHLSVRDEVKERFMNVVNLRANIDQNCYRMLAERGAP